MEQSPIPTRVLRAGPPSGGGKPLDATMGILGLLLLVLSVVLIAILPQDKPGPVQYSVTVVDVPYEATNSTIVYLSDAPGEPSTHQFAIQVAVDNVHSFEFKFDAKDKDEPETEPDQFKIVAYDLGGNPIASDWIMTTVPPRRITPPIDGFASAFEAVNTPYNASVAYRPRPLDAIVDPAFKGETAEQVRERLLSEWRIPTAGEWIVQVDLLATGDCPIPDATLKDVDRATVCQINQPAPEASQADTGNEFSLSFFKYTSFDLVVTKLE